jgi:hypothetical protein
MAASYAPPAAGYDTLAAKKQVLARWYYAMFLSVLYHVWRKSKPFSQRFFVKSLLSKIRSKNLRKELSRRKKLSEYSEHFGWSDSHEAFVFDKLA